MYRVTYSKEGFIKFISHLDLIRLWQRALRRSGVKVEMSKGFSPHPRISFGPPQPLGVAGRAELMDVEVCRGESLTVERLNSFLTSGIRAHEVRPVSDQGKSLCAAINRASYEVEFEKADESEVTSKVEALRASPSLIAHRKTEKGERCRDIRNLIEEIGVGESGEERVVVRCSVKVGEMGNLNPYELLEGLLGWPEERIRKLSITRTALFSQSVIPQLR